MAFLTVIKYHKKTKNNNVFVLLSACLWHSDLSLLVPTADENVRKKVTNIISKKDTVITSNSWVR